MLMLQKLLMEECPTRRTLLNYTPVTQHPSYRIGVYRNHSFELVEHTIKAYLDYAEMSAEFIYSDYDDSLSFFNLDLTTDLLILWLDLNRYHLEALNIFLQERIHFLETIYSHPILVIPFDGQLIYQSEHTVSMSLEPIRTALGMRYFDKRLEQFSGTRMSAEACMLVSEELGLRYLPAMLQPYLKAIVVDLDNTLYTGVLGEEGINGLTLTNGHVQLQNRLKTLASQGLFLCIASKNDERDVLALFDTRKDFPLQKEDFSKICASWSSKAKSIEEIVRFLNINPDSILFIDDNMGELLSVAHVFPQIKQIHASDDAELTCKILNKYPGLFRIYAQKEDKLRKNDVQANAERQKMQSILDPEEYLRSLETKISFSIDCEQQATRIADLANKTNQFIFNYRRYNFSEIMNVIQREDAIVVTASLSDKLSDSGVIGVCVAFKHKEFIEIDECFVSCRALGRGIDDMIVLGMMRCALDKFTLNQLKINFIEGERNEPAKCFVEKNLHNFTQNAEIFNYQIPENIIEMQII